MARVQQQSTPGGGGTSGPTTTTLHRMATLSPNSQAAPNYPGKPRSAILYSTGRSVSITTTALEPTYPWDLDSMEDPLAEDDYDEEEEEDDDEDYDDEDDQYEDDDLTGEPYITDKDNDFQHPSLETSRRIKLLYYLSMLLYVPSTISILSQFFCQQKEAFRQPQLKVNAHYSYSYLILILGQLTWFSDKNSCSGSYLGIK